jgi:hypothetical protein
MSGSSGLTPKGDSVQSVRAGAVLATFAALTAIVQVGGAAPATATTPTTGQVLAYGVNVGGTCVFDPPVARQPGVGARADSDCRLIAQPAGTALVGLPPGLYGSAVPKHNLGSASPASGGLPSVSVLGVLGASTDGYDAFNAFARWSVYNERGQLMYHDEIDVPVQRAEQNGAYIADPPSQAYCATGGGVFPHNPAVTDCWWQPGLSGQVISFVSGGTYADLLVPLAPDQTRISMGLDMGQDGDPHQSCYIDALPPLWSDGGCQVGTEPLV